VRFLDMNEVVPEGGMRLEADVEWNVQGPTEGLGNTGLLRYNMLSIAMR
jgi:hypothetical protein